MTPLCAKLRLSNFNSDRLLAPGDLIKIWPDLILRFRTYPPGVPRYKHVGDVVTDCIDCARYAEPGAIQLPPWQRWSVVGGRWSVVAIMVLLVSGLLGLGIQN